MFSVLQVMVIIAAIGMLGFVAFVALLWRSLRRRAQRLGYSSATEYLAAAPGTDEEKRDAVSLALTGLVLCVLGLLFPPLLLLGVFPLFYGGRKVAWASMGLGLVDDADQPSA
jgi:uncharacterized membrane protein (DUF4010 family)